MAILQIEIMCMFLIGTFQTRRVKKVKTHKGLFGFVSATEAVRAVICHKTLTLVSKFFLKQEEKDASVLKGEY